MRFKMMVKAVLVGLVLIVTSLANAVSLSGAVVKSYIDEPLVIEAEIVGGGEVKLADPLDYLQYDHEIFHYDLYLDILNRGNKKLIRLTTNQPVTDPSFILLLRTKSTMNEPKMLELPIILDFRPEGEVVEKDEKEEEVLEELRDIQETLGKLDDNADKKAPVPQTSTASDRGELGQLATTLEDLERLAAKDVKEQQTFDEQATEQKTSVKQTVTTATDTDMTPSEEEETVESTEVAPGYFYGPVKRGETLWVIANKVRPKNVAVEVMLKELQKANSSIINVDVIREGAVLVIPRLVDGEFVVTDVPESISNEKLLDRDELNSAATEDDTDEEDISDINPFENVHDNIVELEDEDDSFVVAPDLEALLDGSSHDASDSATDEIASEASEESTDISAGLSESDSFMATKDAEQARLAAEAKIAEEERFAEEQEQAKLQEEQRLAEDKRLQEEARKRAAEAAIAQINQESVAKPKASLIDFLFSRHLYLTIIVAILVLVTIIGFILYRRSNKELVEGQELDADMILAEHERRGAENFGQMNYQAPQTAAGSHYAEEEHKYHGSGDSSTATQGDFDQDKYQQELRGQLSEEATETSDLDFNIDVLDDMDNLEDEMEVKIESEPDIDVSDLKTGLSFETDSPKPAKSEKKEKKGKKDEAEDAPIPSLDLDFDTDIAVESKKPKSTSKAEKEESFANDSSLTFDLDNETPRDVTTTTSKATKALEEPDLSQPEEENPLRLEVPAQDLEVESASTEDHSLDAPIQEDSSDDDGNESEKIKLELAEAYIDFDKELAEPLLKEVLKDGNEAQKAKAQELMERIR